MSNNTIKLRNKIQANYTDLNSEWLSYEPELLIEDAEIIAITKETYNTLMEHEFDSFDTEYLLKFENPLELVRDRMAIYKDYDPETSMGRTLSEIANSHIGENTYELDPTYNADVDMEFEM